MANYYTTRFNPMEWPPPDGAIPAGVEWGEPEAQERRPPCCDAAERVEAATEVLGERWAYRTTYRRACPEHGEAVHIVETRLDWISPNEYLLIQDE